MSEKHISIDRDQYEQQVAELREARAKLARLYDPTPIDGAWLEECGGVIDDQGDYDFGDDRWAVKDAGSPLHILAEGNSFFVRTRGEFRRAAELLGITLKEKGGE